MQGPSEKITERIHYLNMMTNTPYVMAEDVVLQTTDGQEIKISEGATFKIIVSFSNTVCKLEIVNPDNSRRQIDISMDQLPIDGFPVIM